MTWRAGIGMRRVEVKTMKMTRMTMKMIMIMMLVSADD